MGLESSSDDEEDEGEVLNESYEMAAVISAKQEYPFYIE